MRHFLPATQLREEMLAIKEEARYLSELVSLDDDERAKLIEFYASNGYHVTYEDELRRAVDSIRKRVETLNDLFARLACDPLIWLGEGNTEEVISLLEELLDKHANKRSRQQRFA
ncbi:MAG TPA: hypothetical protein GXX40_04610 [Firmicutes bacterium]|nr:hypothetical protein [Bacillota bacterium]